MEEITEPEAAPQEEAQGWKVERPARAKLTAEESLRPTEELKSMCRIYRLPHTRTCWKHWKENLFTRSEAAQSSAD